MCLVILSSLEVPPPALCCCTTHPWFKVELKPYLLGGDFSACPGPGWTSLPKPSTPHALPITGPHTWSAHPCPRCLTLVSLKIKDPSWHLPQWWLSRRGKPTSLDIDPNPNPISFPEKSLRNVYKTYSLKSLFTGYLGNTTSVAAHSITVYEQMPSFPSLDLRFLQSGIKGWLYMCA